MEIRSALKMGTALSLKKYRRWKMNKSKTVELVNLILDYGLNNRFIGLDPLLSELYEKDELLLSEILSRLIDAEE